MNLIDRAREILLAPTSAWPAIAAEAPDSFSLYTKYIMPLAAIPAVAGFVGMSLIGFGGFGVSVRVSMVDGLVQMFVGYAMTLAMVFAMALIADALAPGFGGKRDRGNALKLIAYSSTAALVGGMFALIPSLAVLMLVTACYSLYLLFKGVPTLMRVPDEKVLPYTASLIVCSIALSVVAGAVFGMVQGGAAGIGLLRTGGGVDPAIPQVTIDASRGAITVDAPNTGSKVAPGRDQFTIDTPKGAVSLDMDKMQAWSTRMEALGQRLESTQQSGDPVAMERVLKEMEALQREHPLAK